MRTLLVPLILPLASAWVARHERRILAVGEPLSEEARADARALGVQEPDRVRVLYVPRVPLPGWRLARFAKPLVGTAFQNTSGLSARYGIYIQSALRNDRHLLAHELTHTHQYERLGGIRPFLRQYLIECLTTGYVFAGMEVEARNAASGLCRA